MPPRNITRNSLPPEGGNMTREEVASHLKKNHYAAKVDTYIQETEDLDGIHIWDHYDDPEELETDFNLYEYCHVFDNKQEE